MVDASTDIKGILPENIKTVAEADEAIATVRKAIANMLGQMELATKGDTVKVASFSDDDKAWYVRVKGAHRYAKTTLAGLLAKREELLRGASTTVIELVTTLEDATFDKANNTITMVTSADKGRHWLTSLKALIPNLNKGKEHDQE